MDWLERTDWKRRSPEFGALSVRDSHVFMEYTPTVSTKVWSAWSSLKRHPNILVATKTPGFLHYAALDWTHAPLALDDSVAAAKLMTYGNVLARAYEFLSATVKDLAWLTAPLVKFDVEGAMRIAFLNTRAETMPPELGDCWPACDERALVFVIGNALTSLAAPSSTPTPATQIVQRCVERDPAKRFSNLFELTSELLRAGGRAIPPLGLRVPRTTWDSVEEGIGFLELGLPSEALDRFHRTSRRDPKSQQIAELQLAAVQALTAKSTNPLTGELDLAGTVLLPTNVPPSLSPHVLAQLDLPAWPPPKNESGDRRSLPWSEVSLIGRALEGDRNFTGALELYRYVDRGSADLIALELAHVRCQFHLGVLELAEEHVDALLQREPTHRDALALRANILLLTRRYADALTVADGMLTVAPDDARVIYTRGKCLLGLRRLVEAREELDRALKLQPTLVEAMWLRTEVDRMLAKVRATVGTPVPMPVAQPPGELRDALTAGRVDDAIDLLRRSDRDPTAQLLLGDLLLYAARFDEALTAFESINDETSQPAALAGRARSLLSLGRSDEALALLEAIGSDGFTAIRR